MTPTHDAMGEFLEPNQPSELTRRSLVRALGGGLAGAGTLVLPGLGQAKGKGKGSGKVTPRSFRELLAAQGSTSDFFDQYDDDGNKIFDSPFPDYNGWSTPLSDPAHFAYVDYAGVMAKFLAEEEGIRIRTTVHGTVLERRLPEGRAEITVRMITTNALTWIVKLDFDLTQHQGNCFPTISGRGPSEPCVRNRAFPKVRWARRGLSTPAKDWTTPIAVTSATPRKSSS